MKKNHFRLNTHCNKIIHPPRSRIVNNAKQCQAIDIDKRGYIKTMKRDLIEKKFESQSFIVAVP